MRVFAGVAKPFGNSSILPYTKQFFSGGPNSLRAFQINSVGPGTYYQNTDTLGILQLGGDIKLEMNVEYRFNIYRFFKGCIVCRCRKCLVAKIKSKVYNLLWLKQSRLNDILSETRYFQKAPTYCCIHLRPI